MLKTFFTTFSFKKEDYQNESSQQNYSYNQKFHEESKQEEQKNYQNENKSKDKEKTYTKQEEPNQEDEKFKRFDSKSAYTILGVSPDDNYKNIKKAYKKLLREYHPDLNPDNIKLSTEIAQKINGAWEKIEKWKK